MVCDQNQSVPQSSSSDNDHNKLMNIGDERISPNLFLNLNFDANTLDPSANSLKFEWSSFNPNMVSTAVPSIMSSVPMMSKHQTPFTSHSPTYEFLNIDHFNMDSFKNECILNLDHSLLSSVVGDSSTGLMSSENRNSDFHHFTLNDDTKELLDLEKPININITSLETDKY